MRSPLAVLITGSAACAAMLVTAPLRSSAAADRPWTLTIEQLTSPAAADSSAPQLTVQGDRVILSWMERAAAVLEMSPAEFRALLKRR